MKLFGKLNQRGSLHLSAVLGIVVVLGVGYTGYRVLNQSHALSPHKGGGGGGTSSSTKLLYVNGMYDYIWSSDGTNAGTQLTLGTSPTYGNSGSVVYYAIGSNVDSLSTVTSTKGKKTTSSTVTNTVATVSGTVKQVRRSDAASSLAFVVAQNASDTNYNYAVYVKTDSGSPVKIYQNTAGNIYNIQWSPDGQKLLMLMTPTCSSDMCGLRTLYVMNKDGSGLATLASPSTNTWLMIVGGNNSWSSDSTTVAYAEGPSLHTVNVSSHANTTIYTAPSGYSLGLGDGPAWSPDGSKIAFTTVGNTNGMYPKLQYVTPTGQSLTTLATFTQSNAVYFFDWSPDSTKLVETDMNGTVSTGSAGSNLRVVDMAGNLTLLTSSPTYQMGPSEWSTQ